MQFLFSVFQEVFPWLHLFLVFYLFILVFVANGIDSMISLSVNSLSIFRKVIGFCVLILIILLYRISNLLVEVLMKVVIYIP